MTTAINLRPDVYELLHRFYGEAVLREKATEFLLHGITATLEQYNHAILLFEEKYGCSFQEFEHRWDIDIIPHKYSYNVESDFIDWEMLEGEKKNLLSLVTQIQQRGEV
jgi:hypothetical protein